MHKHDLPNNLSRFKHAVCLCCLLDGHRARNDWLNSLLSDQLQYTLFIFSGSAQHAAGKNVYQFEPPGLGIDGGLLAAKIAYEHNSPTIDAGINAGLQCCANQLDYQVNAALVMYYLSHVLLSMVDHHVGAQAAQRRSFLGVARRCSYPAACILSKLDRK
jgi:hypothetical protein